MQILKISLISIAVLSITACNGGGNNLALGPQCKAGYAPISMTPVGNQKKLAMKPGDTDPGLPEGIYTYSRADIFYKENTNVDPTYIHLADTAVNGASKTQSVACMRSFKPNLDHVNNQTNAITDMVVCPNKKIISTRSYKFTINRGQLEFKVPVLNSNKVSEPDQAYPTDPGEGSDLGKVESTLLVQVSPTTYMVNSKVLADSGPYMVSVQMNYKKCPPEGCTECLPTVTGGPY